MSMFTVWARDNHPKMFAAMDEIFSIFATGIGLDPANKARLSELLADLQNMKNDFEAIIKDGGHTVTDAASIDVNALKSDIMASIPSLVIKAVEEFTNSDTAKATINETVNNAVKSAVSDTAALSGTISQAVQTELSKQPDILTLVNDAVKSAVAGLAVTATPVAATTEEATSAVSDTVTEGN